MYKLNSKYSFVYTSNSIHVNYNHQKSVTSKKYWDPKRKHSSQVALISPVATIFHFCYTYKLDLSDQVTFPFGIKAANT